MSIRKLPGTRVVNPSTGQVIYSPPDGESLIADKLANWEKFIHADDDLDPLVRMAVAHYQFEAIHPFHDGNGRTGRIINILMMIQAGLISEPILYPSRYIIRTKNDYYQLLSDITSEDGWEPWILYMLVAIERTATSTLKKVAGIRETQAQIHEVARATRGGRNADFLAVLFEQPYSRISTVMDRCEISRPTATSWLNELVSAGILSDLKFGRVSRLCKPALPERAATRRIGLLTSRRCGGIGRHPPGVASTAKQGVVGSRSAVLRAVNVKLMGFGSGGSAREHASLHKVLGAAAGARRP